MLRKCANDAVGVRVDVTVGVFDSSNAGRVARVKLLEPRQYILFSLEVQGVRGAQNFFVELDGVVGDMLTRKADYMIPEGPQSCPGEGEWVMWVYKSADVLILGGVMLHTPQVRVSAARMRAMV